MKPKPLYLVNTMNSFQTRSADKAESLNLYTTSRIAASKEKDTIEDLKRRLKEMEEVNSQLELSSVENSKKLTEMVETNAKFLSIIAHDLRSPFSVIIGVLELLKDSYHEYSLKDIDKYIRMATNSANGTLSLLDNLLLWTAAQNKARSFNPVKINLHELVIEEFDNIISAATHKLITLSHSIPPKLFLAADLEMVKTIFRNLLNNAIKYSFIGGEITVRATEGKQFVEITVEDNGVGITQKVKNTLFKKNDVHSTRGTNNEFGSGLGLILCKEFVEKHGGTIRIDNEPGKGTKIIFTLPHYI